MAEKPTGQPAQNGTGTLSRSATSEILSQIGELEIERPKRDQSISKVKVTKVRRTAHFDLKSRNFEHLPKEWQEELKKQFGLPPNLVERVSVPGYKEPIPRLLVFMKDYLISHDGLDQKGIFRLAPDAKESDSVKEQLSNDSFTECRDVNCISNLIKVWFRDLPRALLASAPHNKIIDCRTDAHVQSIFDHIEEPNLSIFMWLLDMCGEVTAKSKVNLMTPQNMAIVMTPNLYKTPEVTPGMGPLEAMNIMKLCKKFTEFFALAIVYRQKVKAQATGVPEQAELKRSQSEL